ncbi:MAG: undecaprenyldiphospho-muramoylpentapeptide beta-N-acetylglucosaminyltransferase [Clostridia bacterium]|nr:undecaprenyldiphospho-muramoylpentapeptide beta-N-acetylglucosaminyltransferase [Lachnospiraceae bacterium]NCB99633.1 undecaprenyldiphospho-muramoylpentapeptide beta-N-acetylglucosaminyltransferase [Clostridia bacterium]NCD01837.1 undecaprenyldiphospho-muramoylpentapeptide beta-N-acetylglucosaminyltransferase [Clostridia bacterium]
MKKILLTGGGTAGHVTPNIALMPALKADGYQISYIGSYDGMERRLIEELNIPYYGISSGKLRRYFDIKNFTDPFKVVKGYFEAKKLMKKLNPDVVFSKGGFVTVPVVMAAKRCKIPAIIHESDMTPGLANKLAIPSAYKVCHNFPETADSLPEGKAVLSGSPIRKELLEGDRKKGLEICGFNEEKPVILVIGGSLGAAAINEAVRKALPVLLPSYQIIHVCGKGKVDTSIKGMPGYIQFDFVKQELSDLLACADLIISRAGSNAICEFLALHKPNILIPLPAHASRGDQILNAASFEKQGFSYLLPEEMVTDESLTKAVNEVFENRETYIQAMKSTAASNAIDIIVKLCDEAIGSYKKKK